MTGRVFMNTSMSNSAARRPLLPSRPRQKGASMIEVLVSILLVSVGLLGIAGLSGATFSYNKASQMRLTGIALANDLADRARVNVYGYDLGAYDIDLDDTPESTAVTVPDANLDLDPALIAEATQAANALAAADVDQFLRNVSNRLPQGRAVVVSRPGATTRDLDVWLLWQEAATDRGGVEIFDAGKPNCPNTLTSDEQDIYSCMYFKVGL